MSMFPLLRLRPIITFEHFVRMSNGSVRKIAQ